MVDSDRRSLSLDTELGLHRQSQNSERQALTSHVDGHPVDPAVSNDNWRPQTPARPRNNDTRQRFWAQFRGKDRRRVGWRQSLYAIVTSSCTQALFISIRADCAIVGLNVFIIFIPFAWVARFHTSWGHVVAFVCQSLPLRDATYTSIALSIKSPFSE